MLLNTWSLALSLGSLLVVFLLTVAAISAVRVLRHWNPASDDARQISLESEIWLSSTLVAYALVIQIISLVLLVLAADEFAGVITGAMCATGTLQANEFGLPALLFKLAAVFFYGLWLVLHRLDVSAEHYPLVRVKCWYLLALLPLVAADIALQSLYLFNIEPDVIVSCCAVVFSAAAGGSQFFTGLAGDRLLPWFYGAMPLLALSGGLVLYRLRPVLVDPLVGAAHAAALPTGSTGETAAPETAAAEPSPTRLIAIAAGAGVGAGRWLPVLYGLAWLLFLPLALLTITTVISSYIYAMPFHNCPFCILKQEYAYVGFAIYGTLLPAAFFALSAPLAALFTARFTGPEAPAAADLIIPNYQRLAVRASLLLLLLFAAFSSFHYLRYMLMGGEV